MDTCIHMAQSLHCPPEAITTLLIGYTPIQNKKFLNRNTNVNGVQEAELKIPTHTHTHTHLMKNEKVNPFKDKKIKPMEMDDLGYH